MTIVSMATESYKNWLFHFLISLETTIPEEEKIIFLINFEKSTIKKLRKQFPSVQFIEDERELVPKDENVKGAFKVTYLKGEFIHKAYDMTGEPVLWIDCTALIRTSPRDLLDKLANQETILMRRDFGRDYGKAVYAAEIFGMNDIETIKEYHANCEKRKSEWFSDQLALCEIRTPKRDYIEFGKWSNFYYDEKAASWSDRGEKGSGINTQKDYNFTEEKFIEDLCKRVKGYREIFGDFIQEEKTKPKILVHIDDFQWCYHTTANELAKYLKDKYEFLVIEDADRDFGKYKDWSGDLVWGRCSSRRHQKLLAKRPDLRNISFSSVTTGGELAEDRITSQLQASKGESGIICQNGDVKFRLDYKLEKLGRNQEVFILYNGVNTDKFCPGRNINEKPVVGFVGRTKTYQEDFIKGYSAILKPVCERLDLPIMRATNETGKQNSHQDMAAFYQKIDLLVLLGNCEGHSNTINEAMSCGIPIIAYPTGWHYEEAKNQGIIWCHRNTIELFDVLSDFKANPEKYKELGHKNRKFALERLSWAKTAQYYDSQFKRMIKIAKTYQPIKKDLPVDRKTLGIVKVRYIAEDNGMNSPFGIYMPGQEYKISIEAYNYLKQNFPNKFEFKDE